MFLMVLFKARVRLTKAGKMLLYQAADNLLFSARGYMRVLRVARTIADLRAEQRVDAVHVSEALSFKKVNIFIR